MPLGINILGWKLLSESSSWFETGVTPARIAGREARDQSSPASISVTPVAGSLRWGSTEESAGALGHPGTILL